MKKLVTLFYGMVLLSLPQTIMAQEVDFKWAKSAGGSNDDTGNRIAVDDLGNTYITGYFREIATFGDISLTSQGENDIFIVKLDPNGDFEWVKSAGGENEDFARDIAVDNQGNVYVTGSFSGTATFSSTSVMSVGAVIFSLLN